LSVLLDAQLRLLEDRVALDGRRSGGGGSGGGSLFSRLRTMTELSKLFIDLRREQSERLGAFAVILARRDSGCKRKWVRVLE
jgi:hypothetical protein